MNLLNILLICITGSTFCNAVDVIRAAENHIHFQYQIDTSLFTSSAQPNIQFRASVRHMPDLPNWLRLEQSSPKKPAFLYGTPTAADVGEVFLELIGWNKDDYNTTKKIMRITIQPQQASPVKYQTDFKIANFNLADFLGGQNKLSFSQKVQRIWPNAYRVTKVDKTTNRPGGRFTPTGTKEGVFITIGAENTQPTALKQAKYCNGQKPNPASAPVYTEFSTGEFNISWCHLSMIELSLTSSGQQATQKDPSAVFEKTTYVAVPYDDTRKTDLADWIYVSIPILLGLIFIIILTYIMCCKREGVSKRNAMTPSDQLQHHQSLRRATYRMRTMNSKNEPEEAPPSDPSYSYGRLDENGFTSTPKQGGAERNPSHSLPSTPGTNQRSAIPPPYRMPPTMPSDQASDTDSVPSRPPPYKKPEEGRW